MPIDPLPPAATHHQLPGVILQELGRFEEARSELITSRQLLQQASELEGIIPSRPPIFRKSFLFRNWSNKG
jgi:hypothetical protein